MCTHQRPRSTKTPEVSVIIPTYNHAHFLGEAIQSVLDQIFQDFEIIVVDDGSTDNTKEIISSFKDYRINYIYQKNQGQSVALNTGIQASSSEYIAFLDSDDMWLPEKLELQVEALESATHAGVVYCDLYYYDSTSDITIATFFKKLPFRPPRGRVLNQFIQHFFGTPSTLLVRREVFDKVGKFDKALVLHQDDDMLFRMASCFEFEVVTTPLVKHRIHADQKTRNREWMQLYYIMYLNKTIQSPVLNKKMWSKLRRRLAEYEFEYGVLLIRQGRLGAGARELWGSIRADSFTFLSLVVSLPIRIVIYAFALIRMRAKGLGRYRI